jgi:hypothetical protein
MEKLQVAADDRELFLPKDEKVQVKDLCRLCCNPDVVVPPVSAPFFLLLSVGTLLL